MSVSSVAIPTLVAPTTNPPSTSPAAPQPTSSLSGTGPNASAATSTPGSTATSSGGGLNGDGTSTIATQVDQWIQLIDSGSGSQANQLAAYAGISSALSTIGPGGNQLSNSYWTTSTISQRDAALAVVVGNSSIAQQVQTAAKQFSNQSIALDHAADSAGDNLDPATQSQLARLDQLSQQQQQLIWAGTAPQTGSLDAWKAQLVQDQAIQAADNAASPAPILKITLSDTAKAALASTSQSASTSTSGSTDPSAKALQTLNEKPAVTSASVGLAILQNAAQAKAASNSNTRTSNTNSASDRPGDTTSNSRDSDKPYQAGARLSVTA